MGHTYVIAEIGVNHNGSEELAVRMIDAAVAAGVDAVKFQTFKAEKLVSAEAGKADYQCRNLGDETISQRAMLQKLQLPFEAFCRLRDYAVGRGVDFLSTGFDRESLVFLDGQKMRYWKIPSGEITNLPMLRWVAGRSGQVLLSTGMATLDEIADAVTVLKQDGKKPGDIVILHCTTDYPTRAEDVNLTVLETYKTVFPGHPVGYSDHTVSIFVPALAVALGATVVEKHFTLSRTMVGPDHHASVEPEELSAMVANIRETERVLGVRLKRPTTAEMDIRSVARKSIVAANPIGKGEVIQASDLTTMRPGTGLSPMLWDRVVGSRAVCDFAVGEQIHV